MIDFLGVIILRRNTNKLKLHKSLLSKLSIFLIVLTLFGSLCFGSITAFADDEKEVDYSFYEVTNSISKFASAIVETTATDREVGGVDQDMIDTKISPNFSKTKNVTGVAGGVWGYAYNTGEEDGVFILNFATKNSSEYNHTMLKSFDKATGWGGGPSVCYAQYGYALSQLGVDKAVERKSGGMVNLIAGALLEGCYLLASAVGYLFTKTIDVLSILNPFKLLAGAYDQLSGIKGATYFEKSDFFQHVSKWFQIIQSSSLLCILLIFAFSFAFAFIFRGISRDKQGTYGRSIGFFLLRLFFLLLAIPICGTLYTALLDNLSSLDGLTSDAQERAICKTLVDFENWAALDRLAPPDMSGSSSGSKIVVDTKTGELMSDCVNSRTLALHVNSQVGHISEDSIKSGSTAGDTGEATNSAKTVKYDKKLSSQILGDESGILDMIRRYREGQTLSPASYESLLKGSLSSKDNEGDKKALEALGKIGSDWKSDETKSVFTGESSPPFNFGGSKNMFANGNLGRDEGAYTFKGTRDFKKLQDIESLGGSSPKANKAIYISTDGGLSNMAMYNYLNTVFESKTIKVFSSDDTTSDYGRSYHCSVAFAGSSAGDKFVGFLDALVVMLSVVIIGLVYAINIIVMSIRNGFRMLASAPFAMMGSVKFIAKFLTAFAVMMIEVVTTILFYSLFCELLSVSDSLFTIDGNQALSMLLQLAHMLIVAWITWFAVKNRKIIVKSVDEVLSDISKRIGSNPGQPAGAGANAGASAKADSGSKVGTDSIGSGAGYIAPYDDLGGSDTDTDIQEGANPAVVDPDDPGGAGLIEGTGASGGADGADGASGVNGSGADASATASGEGASANATNGASGTNGSDGNRALNKTGANDLNNVSKDGSMNTAGASSNAGNGGLRQVATNAANTTSNVKAAAASAATRNPVAQGARKVQSAAEKVRSGMDKNERAAAKWQRGQNTLQKHGINSYGSFKDALNKSSGAEKQAIAASFNNIAAKQGINVNGRNIKGDPSLNLKNMQRYNELYKLGAKRSAQQQQEMSQLMNTLRKDRNVPFMANGKISTSDINNYRAAIAAQRQKVGLK